MQIIAHRGWSSVYPENTLLAFKGALLLGCPMIELDIALSKDREVLIFHDENLDRCTDSKGPLRKHNYRELRCLDAGSWFHPAYKGLRIPRLEDLLQIIQSYPQVCLNIEIKASAWDSELHSLGIENKSIQLVQKYDLEQRVLFSSFEWGFLKRLQSLAPELKLALLYEPKMIPPKGLSSFFTPRIADMDWEALYYHCGYQGLHFPYQILSTELLKQIRSLSKKIQSPIQIRSYTVDQMDVFQKLLYLGCDGCFSNAPEVWQYFISKNIARPPSPAKLPTSK